MTAARGTAELSKFGYLAEVPSVIAWDKTRAVHLQTHRTQLTATGNCAVMQAEENVFRIFLDTTCMGFKGVVLSK